MTDRLLLVGVFNEAQRWALPDALIDRLRAGAPDGVRVECVERRSALVERLPEATYLMGLPLAESQVAGRFGPLRFVQLVMAWAETLAPFQAALHSGARVAGAAAIRAEPVAEHAIAMTLALLRRIEVAVTAQSARRWAAQRMGQEMRDLSGSTVGLINLGVVGRAVAARLRPFGCELIATSANQADAAHVDRLLPPANLDELVSVADVIIIADDAPGRAQPVLTRALFDEMNGRALLVNVSSACAYSESELLRALRRGRLAGAAIDCFEHRPLPPNSLLWNAPNVLLTPSVAMASPNYWRRAVDVTLENIRRFEASEPLLDELRAPEPTTARR